MSHMQFLEEQDRLLVYKPESPGTCSAQGCSFFCQLDTGTINCSLVSEEAFAAVIDYLKIAFVARRGLFGLSFSTSLWWPGKTVAVIPA